MVKGSRGSKKSFTAALKIIYLMMRYPLMNCLVVRQVFNTHRDSTWKQLQLAVEKFGVQKYWDFTVAPLEATYKPTGQKIYFRGLDDPNRITSITVATGFLNLAWFEEAYEIYSEESFNKIDLSLRGELPEGYFKQIIMTFNPWHECWIKTRFFDTPNTDDKLALTTTYKCNEWLGEEDLRLFEEMAQNQPQRYRVEGLGEWGVNQEGLVFKNWEVREFNPQDLVASGLERRTGSDLGYIDPTTVIDTLYDKANGIVYVFNEFYKRGAQLDEVEKGMDRMELRRQKVYMDAAEPRTIEYFRRKGFNTVPCIKGPDSVAIGIRFLQNLKIIVHPSCVNMIHELENFAYIKNKKTDEYTDDTTHEYSHCIDACKYAYSDLYMNKKLRTLDKGIFNL